MKNLSSDQQIKELDAYFNSADLDKEIVLSNFELITDLKKFVTTHLGHAKSLTKPEYKQAYIDRLYRLKEIMQKI